MKILEIFWSWPTVVAAVIFLYHRELRTLLSRVATSSKAKFGSLEIEMAPPLLNEPVTLQRVSGQVFHAQRIQLDGKHFESCQFVHTKLVFSGTGRVGLENCIFSGAQWEFSGAAQLTLQFMSALYQGAGEGGSQLIERTFDNVRQGKTASAA